MARLPRLTLPGQPHHVIQRGNNRQDIFVDRQDREMLLSLIGEHAALAGLQPAPARGEGGRRADQGMAAHNVGHGDGRCCNGARIGQDLGRERARQQGQCLGL